jgi:hypothetical protein
MPNWKHPSAFNIDPTPPDVAREADAMGLRVVIYRYRSFGGGGTPREGDCVVWMVKDALSGRDLGSWVPATSSLRVGPALARGVLTPAEALAAFVSRLEIAA